MSECAVHVLSAALLILRVGSDCSAGKNCGGSVPAYSTSRFRIHDLEVTQNDPKDCCDTANSSCSCDLQLSFCAGIHIPDKKHYKDCHYIHFRTPFLSSSDFPYNTDAPIRIRWPLTKWQLTISAHNRKGAPLLEASRIFQNISSHSPVTDVTIENDEMTINFSFYVECEENFYGPACTVFCDESFRDKAGGSFNCSADGRRLCEKGWGGPLCNEPQCYQGCAPHGTCTAPNTCRCDAGWSGAACTECVILAGCEHGFCRRANECICERNWGGRYCNMDLDTCQRHKDLCKNGGICIADEMDSYKCVCTEGFDGKNCETKVLKERIGCTVLDCEQWMCVLKPTFRCELQTVSAEVSSTLAQVNVLGLIVILLIVLILVVVCSRLKAVCENVALIHRMNPLCFSIARLHSADVQVRHAPKPCDKELRSQSPPPSYDSGQCSSSSRSTAMSINKEAYV